MERRVTRSLKRKIEEEGKVKNAEEKIKEDYKAPVCKLCIRKIQERRRFSNRDTCNSHPFCKTCIKNYISAKIDWKVLNITCPQLGCEQPLNPFECKKIIPKQLFVRWCDLLCENAVTGLRRCYCPNPDCSELIIDECYQENLRKTECPMCWKFFCFECILPWNVCEEMHKNGSKKHENDMMFEELVKTQRWTKCPGCHIHVERINGCRFMKCRCNTGFCYTCGKHMQPVGGVELCRCKR